MSDAARALPEPTHWSAPYWDAAAAGRLVLQACQACEKLIMYPKRVCPFCLGEDLAWRPSPGEGSVYSFTVQEAAPPSGFEDMVPYVLAIVRLDEGVQLMANVVGPDAAMTACGDRVRVEFRVVRDGVALPVFRRAGGEEVARER